MKLDFTQVHLSPLVNSYKGRDYFSAFVFYSANLKDLTNLTKARIVSLACASGMQSLDEVYKHGRKRRVLCEIREICVRI